MSREQIESGVRMIVTGFVILCVGLSAFIQITFSPPFYRHVTSPLFSGVRGDFGYYAGAAMIVIGIALMVRGFFKARFK